MAFLRECELLKIEDVLPFFPDFVLIDDFKDEISAALAEYNTHIDDLKHEMDAATQSAEAIRRDIRDLRNKYAALVYNGSWRQSGRHAAVLTTLGGRVLRGCCWRAQVRLCGHK